MQLHVAFGVAIFCVVGMCGEMGTSASPLVVVQHSHECDHLGDHIDKHQDLSQYKEQSKTMNRYCHPIYDQQSTIIFRHKPVKTQDVVPPEIAWSDHSWR